MRDPGARVGASGKKEGIERLEQLIDRLVTLHNRLYGESTRSVLLILQGTDASGKDGTIRTVFTGVNPQGCRVQSFKVPTVTELAHDYLWRIHNVCPARGEIVIFNRSHYEDVIAVRVRKLADEKVWRRRYEHIRSFEKLLTDEGTTVVKVFLHLSRDEQRKRLQERLDDPEKRWKFGRPTSTIARSGTSSLAPTRTRCTRRRPTTRPGTSSGRPQLVTEPRGRRDPRRRARTARSEAAGIGAGHREHDDRLTRIDEVAKPPARPAGGP